MVVPMPTYKRAPSEELLALFADGRILAPVLELARRKVGGHYHDVNFRDNDEVYLYRGHSAVLQVRRYKRAGGLNVDADKKYKRTLSTDRIFGRWSLDGDDFEGALRDYLDKVDVAGSLTLGEGDIQLRWSQVTQPWTPFDREAVLGYRNYARGEERENARKFDQVSEARIQLEKCGLAKLPKPGRELDQLAIDQQGQLVLLELKDGSKSNAEVYYSPYQLLQYVWEWHTALEAARDDLQELISARNQLETSPHRIPDLTGGIRAAVGFGFDTPRGKTRLNYAKVLEVVNRHRPCGVKPIETWAFADTGPTRLAI